MPSTTAGGGPPMRASLTLGEVAAKNVRNYRALRGMTQSDLAARLAPLGLAWVQTTVSEVERNGRAVTVDELADLAVGLGVSVAALLDPAGPERANERELAIGSNRTLPPPLALKFITERWLDAEAARWIEELVLPPMRDD